MRAAAVSPFEDIFLRRREEIERLVSVTSRALAEMHGMPELLDALGRDDEEVEAGRRIAEVATAEVDAHFPMLHGAATILLWGALEAAVRDFLVLWMHDFPEARETPELLRIKVTLGEYERLGGEDRMRYVLGLLERNTGALLQPGAGRFDALLKIFGLRPSLSDEQRRDLLEMNAVRNVLVHRAGIADDRLLKLCPWLKVAVGDRLTVRWEDLSRYIGAASHYAAGVVRRVKEKTTEYGHHGRPTRT
jgi:hypothetical protein